MTLPEILMLICFHLYLLFWAIVVCWRSTRRRTMLAILIGAIISTFALQGFYNVYQKIAPQKSLNLTNHLYAIIGYGIVVSILNAVNEKKRQK